MEPQQAPDLASVLKTLSNYTPTPTGALNGPRQRFIGASVGDQSGNSWSQTSQNAGTSDNNHHGPWLLKGSSVQPPTTAEHPSVIRSAVASDAKNENLNVVSDPSKIVKWSHGLRYVTKATAQDERIAAAIQKMIKSQHDHERQWWAGREALIQRQKDRVEGKRKLDEVLRSVGGQVATEPVVIDEKVELLQYDKKIHRALTHMVSSMSDELKVLRVPFFCTDEYLVKSEPEITSPGDSQSDDRDVRLTRSELDTLQKRMLSFLEDMYKD